MSDSRRTVIVGGGVVGASCAYYLAKTGRSVTLVDSGAFGNGCSHANCGFISPSHVLPLAVPGAVGTILKFMSRPNSPVRVKPGVVLKDPGWFLRFARNCREGPMLAGAAGLHALLRSSRSLYEGLVRDERIDCDWQTQGMLFVFRSPEAMDHYAEVDRLLGERFETPARRIDGAELAEMVPALKPGLAGAWFYEGDAHLRPDRLMTEWKRILTGLGVTVEEHRKVVGIAREGRRATAVRTISGDLPADEVIVAAGAWTPFFRNDLGCKLPIQPGKGYSMTLPNRPAGIPHPMIFEEDRVAITPFRDGYRIGSMMEFIGPNEALDPNRLNLLVDTANRYFRGPVSGDEPEEQWWGWRPMTPDSLPMIGPVPSLANAWVAAGHNMLGLSMAPATGKLISELVLGTPPHVSPVPYAVNRF